MSPTSLLTIARRPTPEDGIIAIQIFLSAVPAVFVYDLLWLHTLETGGPMRWWAANGTAAGWSLGCACVAVIGLLGAFQRFRRVRPASAIVLGLAHAFVAFGFHMGSPHGTGTGTYSLMAALAAWRFWLER